MTAAADIPDLDRAVFRARVHPLGVTLETDGRHVAGVALKNGGLRLAGPEEVEDTNLWVSSHSQQLLVRRDF